MGGRFYQDELGSSLGPQSSPSAQPPASPLRPPPPGRRPAAAVPGRTKATLLHVLVPLGGPVGLVLSIVVGLFAGRDRRPLVRDTEAAILRFAAQLAVLAGVGIVLVVTGHEDWAVPPLVLMAGAYLVLPLVAAAWTYRTGRVFRYPLWDLLRRPDR